MNQQIAPLKRPEARQTCSDSSRTTRRTFLQATAASAAAGALISSGKLASTTAAVEGTDGVVEGFTILRGSLAVHLDEMGAADTVRLLDDTEQTFREASPGLGATAVDVPLSTDDHVPDSYEPGEYTAVALDEDDNEVGRGTIQLQPEFEVVGFRVILSGNPVVVLENTGSGPAKVDAIRILEGAPRYTDDSGGGGSGHDSGWIAPGDRVVFGYDNEGFVSPFQVSDPDTSEEFCGETVPGEVEVETEHGELFTTELDLEYDSELVEEEQLGGNNYPCAEVLGGEVMPYE